MSQFKSYRKESRTDWGSNVQDGSSLDRDQLKLGCMLRIADATEAMAKNHVQLQAQLDWHKRYGDQKASEVIHLKRQLAAARGQITLLRKRVAARTTGGEGHE